MIFIMTLNNDLKVNTPIQITQYSPDTNAVSPVTTKVLATGFSKTKGRNAYVITSSLGSSNYIALWEKILILFYSKMPPKNYI